MKSLGRQPFAWLALCVVIAGLIAIGGSRNVASSGTSQDRLYALAEQLKCVQCIGESVAGSQAPIAKTIRSDIQKKMDEGRTDDEILSYFANSYGDEVLLIPASTGIASLVWVIPVIVAGLGMAAVGVKFVQARQRRRQGAFTEPSPEEIETVERARAQARNDR